MMDGWYKAGRRQINSVTETDRNGAAAGASPLMGPDMEFPKASKFVKRRVSYSIKFSAFSQ